jgi:protein TonB
MDASLPRRDRSLPIIGGLLLVSALGHLALYAGANAYARSLKEERAQPKPMELVMFEVERPRPPPPPADTPPPPNDAPPPEAPSKPVPLLTGISMSSTSTAGSFAAPVGNTLYGKLPERAANPSDVQPYQAPEGRFVPAYQADTQPRVLQERKLRYSEWPEEARRAGIEGHVLLSVVIDAQGDVTEVKVLRGPGYGLEAAAARAVRGIKWKPATQNGQPVATEIKYTYTFLQD